MYIYINMYRSLDQLAGLCTAVFALRVAGAAILNLSHPRVQGLGGLGPRA